MTTTNQNGTLPRRRGRPLAVAALAAMLLACATVAPSCRIFGGGDDHPRVGPNKVRVDELQSALQDAGDEMIARFAAASLRIIELADDPAHRRGAMEVRVAVANSVIITNSQVSPLAALLDMMLVSYQTMRFMELRSEEFFGEHGQRLVVASQRSEEAIRSIASQALTEDMVREFYAYVDERMDVSKETFASVTTMRVSEFDLGGHDIGRISGGDGPRSVFQLLYLDPLAGLDQSAREIQQTRILAERAMYQFQRTIPMVAWKLEALWQAYLDNPEVQRVLASFEDISDSSRRFAAVAEQLGETVSDERTAIVAEVESAVARQRAALVEDVGGLLETEREELVTLAENLEQTVTEGMRETRLTVEASERLAESSRELIDATDRLVERFQPPEGAPPAEPSSRTDPAAYQETAAEIARAAEKLTEGIEALQRVIDSATGGDLTATAQQASQAAAQASQGVLNAFFWRALILILVAGVCLLGALLIAIAVARRSLRPA